MLKPMCLAAGRMEATPSQSSRSVQASLAAAEEQIEALNQRVNRKNAQLAEAHTALLAARQDMQLHSQSSARSAGGGSEHGELNLAGSAAFSASLWGRLQQLQACTMALACVRTCQHDYTSVQAWQWWQLRMH